MGSSTRTYVHVALAVIGAVLIVGGIVQGSSGAWIIGLIVAAVNVQQLMALARRR